MSKEDVMDYVMTTPSNPNRAVLEGMLDEISGTQLPSPTVSDNGKVLGVDNGEYKLVEQSSRGKFVITATESEGHFTFDKTYTEIEDAFNSGTDIYISMFGREVRFPHVTFSDTPAEGISDITLGALGVASSQLLILSTFRVNSENTVEHAEATFVAQED